jgi:photosystem II stability/assembly factor-like uncharacterized protein
LIVSTVASSRETLLVSTRKGLFVIEGRGAAAHVAAAHFVGDNVTLALADRRDGAWYAALDHGHFGVKLHRSDDRGVTWTEIAAPAYPPKPDDADDKDMWGKPIPWSTRLLWALEIAPDADGALWAGTIPGGLFRSDDRGASWRLIESLWHHPLRKQWNGGGYDPPGLHSICVDPRDPRTIVVGISTGGVMRSRDGGETWTTHCAGMVNTYSPPEQASAPENQDIHHLVQSPSNPEVWWCQHHCGAYRSGDDLATWQPLTIAPSSFGFTVAVHPRDPGTAWFVPANSDQKRTAHGQVVVTRTRDGGHTFTALTDGLPQTHAYDLFYRHALDLAPDGDQLAIGSTTGNLFVTADQGDHWHHVTGHLPPIYAVRYA